ncbi:recombination protein RecR [Candidatus Saccharibacteria bacterium]|nr:recombination protein RecR [Candidatus Saccharibacteria bacterium]HPG37504.1 recombination mediator RecR [Candidatus Saccharibacteria bacterium]
MAQVLPPALQAVIDAFAALPGVGARTAERYAYSILKRDPSVARQLAGALEDLPGGVGYCTKTFALVPAGQSLSDLYTDPRRDKTVVAVVAEPFDVVALEKTGQYHGTYHVLGGLVSPIDGVSPEQLHIAELVARISEDNVKEVILATNASVEGESTALYIQQQLDDTKVTVTRLARGLAVGVDLEYADQITLGRALENRTKL